MRRLHLGVVSVGLIGIVGCRDTTAPLTRIRLRVQPAWVTGEAAAALDTTTGLMEIATPAGIAVSMLAADSAASAYLRIVIAPGPFNVAPSEIEADRGGPVDFAHLHRCGGATYEWSPFGTFPATVPAFLQRTLSSWWAIPICGGDGTAQVSIGVSDSPRLYIIAGDSLEFGTSQSVSGSFGFTGVPDRYPSGVAVTPEEAVRAVFVATGKRVSTVPVPFDELDNNGLGQLPMCASWRMSIEAPELVQGERTGAVWSTDEFFVHHAPACFSDSIAVDAAVPDQPSDLWVTVSTTGDSVDVPVIGPVRFDRITVVH